MIELDKYEKQWILLTKGSLQDEYPFKKTWVETLKPLFKKIYGWDPDEDNNYDDAQIKALNQRLIDLYKYSSPKYVMGANGQILVVNSEEFDNLVKNITDLIELRQEQILSAYN